MANLVQPSQQPQNVPCVEPKEGWMVTECSYCTDYKNDGNYHRNYILLHEDQQGVPRGVQWWSTGQIPTVIHGDWYMWPQPRTLYVRFHCCGPVNADGTTSKLKTTVLWQRAPNTQYPIGYYEGHDEALRSVRLVAFAKYKVVNASGLLVWELVNRVGAPDENDQHSEPQGVRVVKRKTEQDHKELG